MACTPWKQTLSAAKVFLLERNLQGQARFALLFFGCRGKHHTAAFSKIVRN